MQLALFDVQAYLDSIKQSDSSDATEALPKSGRTTIVLPLSKAARERCRKGAAEARKVLEEGKARREAAAASRLKSPQISLVKSSAAEQIVERSRLLRSQQASQSDRDASNPFFLAPKASAKPASTETSNKDSQTNIENPFDSDKERQGVLKLVFPESQNSPTNQSAQQVA